MVGIVIRPRHVGVLLALAISGCGYHVAGRTDALPKTIHVIAVPTMENKSSQFKIEQILTAATIHEFLAKTTYKVVSDPNGGDAVLNAKVLTVEVAPLLFQSPTVTSTTNVAQATAMIITMKCEVTLTERDNEKVLYHTDNFVFRNEYQLATEGTNTSSSPSKGDVETFFQEGDPAVGRMAHDFATRLVAAVTENY
jgi:outer membrane lipopolysaccharide assembly protein LptE/RlpB